MKVIAGATLATVKKTRTVAKPAGTETAVVAQTQEAGEGTASAELPPAEQQP
jgi:hypothetical protein